MTDDTQRKTLTLKKAPASAAAADASPRKRTGARAKQAAQQARERSRSETTPPDAAAAPNTGVPPQIAGKTRSGSRASAAPQRPGRRNDPASPSRAAGRGAESPRTRGANGPDGRAAHRGAKPAAPAGQPGFRAEARTPRGLPPLPTLRPGSAYGNVDGDSDGIDQPAAQLLDVGDDDPGHFRVPSESRRAPGRAAGPVSARAARFDAATVFPIFAPCPQGLEQALADELHALGFDAVRPARAGCHFYADWTGVLRANLHSRLATRILVQLAHAPVDNEDDILALASDTPWEQWFGPRQTLRVDTSAIRSPMQSLQYCNLRVKDGICDRLREREGSRPDIDTVRPDARVHLFLDETTATLYLDTTGESLFKRGWRLDKGEAPLRENLASGLLALAGWQPGQPLLDPFCGSGTILIEAAGIALGAPPGIWRPFGFERLRNHDERRWRDLKDAARAGMASRLDTPLVGCDLDANAIDAAQANAKRAWLTPDAITFRQDDALRIAPPSDSGWIITNPPYGERLETTDDTFWRRWSEHLKHAYAGWQVGAISSNLSLAQQMRLKPRRRIPLYNGALECRLFLFDLVEAGYRK